MTEITFIDSDHLIRLGREQHDFGNPSLNTIFTHNNAIILTSTVYEEATRNSTQYPGALVIKTWIDEGVAASKLTIVDTPEYSA